ncbi:MAG: hypothetical protein US69_C0003G0022 [candidate division TM6 bacterium GW2011_GWF2_38_10]|nr:MAG: hypothetical protein US69_C0003G0022 [candidate division TM6 bacterium GW2011_GWF2_38_10]
MFKKVQAVLALVVVSCMPMQIFASRNVKRCAKQARMQQQKWQERVSERSQLMPKPSDLCIYTHSEKTITSPLGLAFMTTLALSALSHCESCNKEKSEALSNMHWDKIVDVFLPGGFAQGAAAVGYAIKDCKKGLETVASCFNKCNDCEDLGINILNDYTIENSSEYDNQQEFYRFVVPNYSSYSSHKNPCLSAVQKQCQPELKQLYETCVDSNDKCVWSIRSIIVNAGFVLAGLIVLRGVAGLCKGIVVCVGESCEKIVDVYKKIAGCRQKTSNPSRVQTPFSSAYSSAYQSRETTPVCNPQRFYFKKS